MLDGCRACYAIYETKDERYLSVGALEPKFWELFCEIIDRKDFIPLLEAPLHEQYRLKYEIQMIISRETLSEWMEIFSDVEACVSPVLAIDDMVKHPQVLPREMLQRCAAGPVKNMGQAGMPIELSERPGRIRTPAPKLGEHTDTLL